MAETIGCSIYTEWKTIDNVNRFGSTIHKATAVWET